MGGKQEMLFLAVFFLLCYDSSVAKLIPARSDKRNETVLKEETNFAQRNNTLFPLELKPDRKNKINPTECRLKVIFTQSSLTMVPESLILRGPRPSCFWKSKSKWVREPDFLQLKTLKK